MKERGFIIVEKFTTYLVLSVVGMAIVCFLFINTAFVKENSKTDKNTEFLIIEDMITEAIDAIIAKELPVRIGKTKKYLYYESESEEMSKLEINSEKENINLNIINYEIISVNCLKVNYGDEHETRHLIFYIPRGITTNESID